MLTDLPKLLILIIGMLLFSIEIFTFGGGAYASRYVPFILAGLVIGIVAWLLNFKDIQKNTLWTIIINKIKNINKKIKNSKLIDISTYIVNEDKNEIKSRNYLSSKIYGKRMAKSEPQLTRVAVLGTRGSGKTTVLGLIYLTATDETIKDNNKLVATIEEINLGARDIPSMLMDGDFPPPTGKDEIFEANLILEWQRLRGLIAPKKIILPFVETAGETLQEIIRRFSRGVYDIKDLPKSKEIHDNILNCNGFIIVTPVPRALRMEKEDDTVSPNPDVNVARFLDAIFKFKKGNVYAPQIKAITIMFTKYDEAKYQLSTRNMDLSNDIGIKNFNTKYYPQTYAALKAFGLDKVSFVYSFIETQIDDDGKTTNKVKVDTNTRRPQYSKESYINLLNWIKDVF